MKPSSWLCILLISNNVASANCCGTSTKTNSASRSIVAPAAEVVSITNIAKVGWQVLASLERSVDARCALFVVSLRFGDNGTDDKEYYRDKLETACLGGWLFKSEIANAFHLVRVLDSDATDAELRKAVSASIALDEGSARDLFCDIVKDFSRPRSDVARQVEDGDYTSFMTQRERVLYIGVYTYFKAVLMQRFSRHLVEHVETDSPPSNETRKVWFDSNSYEKGCLPSDEEIDFVSSIVRNGRGDVSRHRDKQE